MCCCLCAQFHRLHGVATQHCSPFTILRHPFQAGQRYSSDHAGSAWQSNIESFEVPTVSKNMVVLLLPSYELPWRAVPSVTDWTEAGCITGWMPRDTRRYQGSLCCKKDGPPSSCCCACPELLWSSCALAGGLRLRALWPCRMRLARLHHG